MSYLLMLAGVAAYFWVDDTAIRFVMSGTLFVAGAAWWLAKAVESP